MIENENKSNEDKNNEASNEEALKIVKDAKKELAEYRSEFEKSWKIYDDAYYNKQHKTGENIKTVKNFIFKTIESEVPVLTDSYAATAITASIEEKQDAANILEKSINYVYQDQNLPLILPTLVRASLTSAPGYLYVFYNPDADCGEGKIEYKQLPWKSVYLDGNAQTIEQAEKARIELPLRREQVARMYPEKKNQILQVKGGLPQDNGLDEGLETRDVAGLTTEIGKPKDFKAKDIAIYAETWVQSYELKDVEPEETQEDIQEENNGFLQKEPAEIEKWEDHNAHIQAHKDLRAQLLSVIGLPGDTPFEEVQAAVEQLLAQNPQASDIQEGLLIVKMIDNHLEEHEDMKKLNPTGQEPKYEDGWRVIKTFGDIVLYDGENPLEDGNIPLVPFYCYKDQTIYGFGEIKNILNSQQSLNDMDFREFEGLRLNSNSGWIVDHEAEVDEKDLTNAPGIVVKKKMGTEVRRAEAGIVSPQLNQRRESDRMAIELISGITEAVAPNMNLSQQSGVAVQKIQTQAVGRIRLKDRYLQNYSMRRLAIITASFIIHYWTDEKRMRLRSDGTSIEEVIYNPIEMEELEYTVEVSPGSMAGVDKDALNAFYLMLLNNQHINFKEFLSVADFPKKEILMKLLEERQNDQAAQATQAAQEQIQGAQVELQKMANENKSLKDILLPEEKRLMDEMARKQIMDEISAERVSQPMEPIATNEGQASNQGIFA